MTIECKRCKSANPVRKRFCGECGELLDPAFVAMKEFLNSALREQVHGVLKECYKDQKVIEVETSQAIAARFADWAKLLGFFLGIPIALFLLVLAVAGIRTYSDFSNQIQKTQNEISVKFGDAQKLAGKLQTDGVLLTKEYERLSAGLGNSKEIALKVEALTKDYDKLAAGLEKAQKLANRVETLDKQIVNIKDSIRSALVLGNNHYPNLGGEAQLQKAVNDARAIGGVLQEIGFKITTGENLRRQEMLNKFHEFTKQIVPGDMAFIFYSGHGVQVGDENYLIPSDFKNLRQVKDYRQIKDDAISINGLMESIRASKASVVVLVIDACRDNPFTPDGSRGLAGKGLKPAPIAGMLTLFSADSGQTALEKLGYNDNDPNSVFTRVLVSALKKRGIELQELVSIVRDEVLLLAQSSGVTQSPAYYNDLVGPVYLSGR